MSQQKAHAESVRGFLHTSVGMTMSRLYVVNKAYIPDVYTDRPGSTGVV